MIAVRVIERNKEGKMANPNQNRYKIVKEEVYSRDKVGEKGHHPSLIFDIMIDS